jgi:predicted small lipoprotein YifL
MVQRKKYSVVLLFIVLLVGMSACGQKGDLYLPDREQSSLDTPVNTA